MNSVSDQPAKSNKCSLLAFVAILGLFTMAIVSCQVEGDGVRAIQSPREPASGKSFIESMSTKTTTPVPDSTRKSAWVDASVVSVQMWPGKGHPVVAEVFRGQEVRIVQESDDGEWSLLDHPVQGWVSMEHLRYAEKYISPRLTPTSFRTYRWVKADPRLRVRSDPDTDSAIVTHMAHGELLEIDRFTDDMQWVHIIAPTEGWASTKFLSTEPISD